MTSGGGAEVVWMHLSMHTNLILDLQVVNVVCFAMGVSSDDGVSEPTLPVVDVAWSLPPSLSPAVTTAGGHCDQFKLESKLEAREVSLTKVTRAQAPFYGPLNAVSQLADVGRWQHGWFLWRW